MKKLITIGLMLLGTTAIQAQSFHDLDLFTENSWKIFYQHTSQKGTYTGKHSGPSISMALRSESDQQYGFRWDYELSAIGYASNMLYTILKEGTLNKYNDHTFITSGPIGWHKGTINVVATDRLLISPGFSAGDHFIATQLNGTDRIINVIGAHNYLGHSTQTIDPSGWYLYAGPAVKATYVLTPKMWVDAYANYDFTLVKLIDPSGDYKKNPDYPLPTVFMFGADLYTSYLGLFVGVRASTLKDKGYLSNDTKRFDISVGFQF